MTPDEFVKEARLLLETCRDEDGHTTDFGDEGDRLAAACDHIEALSAALRRIREKASPLSEHGWHEHGDDFQEIVEMCDAVLPQGGTSDG